MPQGCGRTLQRSGLLSLASFLTPKRNGGKNGLPWNSQSPLKSCFPHGCTTLMPSPRPALDSWCQRSHSQLWHKPQSLLPGLTAMVPDTFLSSKRNCEFPHWTREGPSVLAGVCGSYFPSARELLTFQSPHGGGRDARQQEGSETAERQ